MEIKINLEVSLSAETLNVLKILAGSANADVQVIEPVKEVKKPKAAKEETKLSENGTTEKPVSLSDIRQHVAKSEANKTAARGLFAGFGIKALTELPAEKYAEFYGKLTEANDL